MPFHRKVSNSNIAILHSYYVFLFYKESFATNYVLDVNRAIRQREELEKLDALAKSIDSYEIVSTLIIHYTTIKLGIFSTKLPRSIYTR